VRFVLDENFPRRAEALLARLGHEILDIRDTEICGSDDIDVFDFAQTHSAILLTTDRDFFHTVPFLYERHHGAVIIALSQPNASRILDRLQWALGQTFLHRLANNCLLLTDRRAYFTLKDA
jgi:predicted nuclease of predicted toxin-antitoxin system